MSPAHRTRWFAIIALFAVVSAGLGFVLAQTVPTSPLFRTAEGGAISSDRVASADDAGLPYVIDPSVFADAGPGKDGIPSIDTPKFVSVQAADAWIGDDELVLALAVNGLTRAYPLQILVWHNIVNDVIAGEPVAITYCPLSGTAAAYKRMLGETLLEFGNSGKLYNSNVLMYDRATDTYWSQMEGLALSGPLAGQELASYPIDVVPWGAWKSSHTDAEVLSRDTGFDRAYGQDPYGNYCHDDSILFPVEERDDRIAPKTVVFVVDVDGTYVAYREQDLLATGSIDDRVNGVRLRITRDASGVVRTVDRSSQEMIRQERGYWFAWIASHPDVRLYLP